MNSISDENIFPKLYVNYLAVICRTNTDPARKRHKRRSLSLLIGVNCESKIERVTEAPSCTHGCIYNKRLIVCVCKQTLRKQSSGRTILFAIYFVFLILYLLFYRVERISERIELEFFFVPEYFSFFFIFSNSAINALLSIMFRDVRVYPKNDLSLNGTTTSLVYVNYGCHI